MTNDKDIYEMAVAMSKKELQIAERLFKEQCETAMKPDATFIHIIMCQEAGRTLERVRREYNIHLRHPC